MPDIDASRTARAIAGWLPQARWFAGKGEPLGNIVITEEAQTDDGTGVVLAIATPHSQPPDRELDRYFLPLIGGDAAQDAATEPAFARWLIATVLSGGRLEGRAGRFVGHRLDTAREPDAFRGAALRDVVVRPVGGDASNTSFLVSCRSAGVGGAADDTVHTFVVKLLRRCRQGIQPEVEVGCFLTQHAGWSGTPRLHGWLEYQPAYASAATDTIALATVHNCLHEAVSLWDAFMAEATQLPGHVSLTGLELLAARLGRLTAEMHRALACRGDVPAFAPEPPPPAAMAALAADLEQRITKVCHDLAAATLPTSLAPRIRSLVAGTDLLRKRAADLSRLLPTAAFIRIHGDYHLGQVLINRGTGSMWAIDFEGEPGRSLAERRAKTSVCKDLAGMVRSFDYFRRQAGRLTGQPVTTNGSRSLPEVFLAAYAAEAVGQPWWPIDPVEQDRLLSAFILEKAIYELAYEIHNRPDWVEVPLAAVEELIATAA